MSLGPCTVGRARTRRSRPESRPSTFGPAWLPVLAAAAAGAIVAPAIAAVTEPPAHLDFGLVLGGWGVYADGDGEPSIPDQSLEAWLVPSMFDESWSMQEAGAQAVALLQGTSTVGQSGGDLVVQIGITASVSASVPSDAPPGATAIAEASFDEVYLSFEILEASVLTIESLQGDGGWVTVASGPVSPGFDDVSLSGAFVGVTAGPGELLEDDVSLAWRITVAAIPGPGAAAGLLLAGLRTEGRRRRR